MQYSNFALQLNSQLRMKTYLMTIWRHFLNEQTLNLECSRGSSCESSSSVSSTNALLGLSLVISWAIPTTLFYSCGTNSESCLKYVLDCYPTGRSTYSMSHPHHPGGWQQIHFKNFWVHGSIHLPFNNMDFVKRKSPIPGCMIFFYLCILLELMAMSGQKFMQIAAL